MVMASGREITMDDLPADLRLENVAEESGMISSSKDWQHLLHQHISQRLERGETRILDSLTPVFEGIAVSAAMRKTGGRKKDASDLLGWGRNTLTRKLKELNVDEGEELE